MQVKLFNTRLDAGTIAADQKAINDFMSTVTVKSTATQFVNGAPDFWSILIFYEVDEQKAAPKTPPTPPAEDEPLTEEQQQILLALKTWRKDKANELQQPEFMVLQNATLERIVRVKPTRVIDLDQIKGMNNVKTSRFGDDIIAILNAF